MYEYYTVEITEVYHANPSAEPHDWREVVDTRVASLAEAREVIRNHVPVSLESGEPTHFETADGGEYNTGRCYHFWRDYGDRNEWIDSWVAVEKITAERVNYGDVVSGAEPDQYVPAE